MIGQVAALFTLPTAHFSSLPAANWSYRLYAFLPVLMTLICLNLAGTAPWLTALT